MVASVFAFACERSDATVSDSELERPPGRVAASTSSSELDYVDVAVESGLDFVHESGARGRYHMPEILGAGAALFDYDRDGDLDIYFVQGGVIEDGDSDPSVDDSVYRGDRLYRNELSSSPEAFPRFEDVSSDLGLEPFEAHGMGVVVADVDGDGWPDLYRLGFGDNVLLLNQAGAQFSDATARSGLVEPRWSTAATFLDYDRDGLLDLFVGNYIDYEPVREVRCRDLTGAQDYCGPGRFPFVEDALYRGLGDGRFEDVSRTAIVGARPAPALGVVATDLDGDGWQDLYVANDAQANHYWHNQADGTFTERALEVGNALDVAGRAEGSMGVDAGDVDGDGDLDLFLTHLMRETNTLYLNDGSGQFVDRSQRQGMGAPSLPFTSFGTVFVDADLDGWLDVFVASGSIANLPELARQGDPYPFAQSNQFFKNLGNGEFRDVTAGLTVAAEDPRVSRGVCAGDVDNDGDEDLLVTNNNGAPRLLLNQRNPEKEEWIGLLLLEPGAASQSERTAFGAMAALLVESEGEVSPLRWRRVRTAASYASANDPRLILATAGSSVVGVRVRWADGELEDWRDIESGLYLKLVRGRGTSAGETPTGSRSS